MNYGADDSIIFATKEHATTAIRPYLNITYEYISEPRWYDNSSITTPNYNPDIQAFYFNITWNSSIPSVKNISWAYIETNLSGAATNYTMNNDTWGSGIYNWTYSTIRKAAQYYWKSYANTTGNDWNSTDTWYFTLAQNTTNIMRIGATYAGSTFNNTNVAPDSTDTVTLTCTNDYSSSGSGALTINNIVYATPDVRTWGVGVYLVLCNTTGNTNYTSNTTGINITMTVTAGGSGGTSSGGGGASLSVPIASFANITEAMPLLSMQPGLILEAFLITYRLPIIGTTPIQTLFIGILLFIPAYRKIKHKALTRNDGVLFGAIGAMLIMVFIATIPGLYGQAANLVGAII